MSTRSIIAVKENGKFKGAYCHFDGYPSGVGAILKEHYTDLEKVKSLIALGALSSLAPSIECPEGHTFENPVNGYTVAYHRDRGDAWKVCQAEEVANVADFSMVDYIYLFVCEEGSTTGFWEIVSK